MSIAATHGADGSRLQRGTSIALSLDSAASDSSASTRQLQVSLNCGETIAVEASLLKACRLRGQALAVDRHLKVHDVDGIAALDVVIAFLADDHHRQRKGDQRGDVMLAPIMEAGDDGDLVAAEIKVLGLY